MCLLEIVMLYMISNLRWACTQNMNCPYRQPAAAWRTSEHHKLFSIIALTAGIPTCKGVPRATSSTSWAERAFPKTRTVNTAGGLCHFGAFYVFYTSSIYIRYWLLNIEQWNTRAYLWVISAKCFQQSVSLKTFTNVNWSAATSHKIPW